MFPLKVLSSIPLVGCGVNPKINVVRPDLVKTRSSHFPAIYERQRPSRAEKAAGTSNYDRSDVFCCLVTNPRTSPRNLDTAPRSRRTTIKLSNMQRLELPGS